jgi:hypothetical protein
MASDLGRDFAEALAHKDAARLKALLRPDVEFRAMTPILLGQWFEPCDEITHVSGIEMATSARASESATGSA